MSISRLRLTATSTVRSTIFWISDARNPSPKMIQLGFNTSSRTLPVSRSRNVGNSMISIPARRHSRNSCIGKSATPVVHRNHDFVDRVLDHPAIQVVRALDEAVVGRCHVVALGCDEADQPEAALVRPAAQLQQARRASTGAVDEDPTLEEVLVHDVLEQEPRHE